MRSAAARAAPAFPADSNQRILQVSRTRCRDLSAIFARNVLSPATCCSTHKPFRRSCSELSSFVYSISSLLSLAYLPYEVGTICRRYAGATRWRYANKMPSSNNDTYYCPYPCTHLLLLLCCLNTLTFLECASMVLPWPALPSIMLARAPELRMPTNHLIGVQLISASRMVHLLFSLNIKALAVLGWQPWLTA